MIVQSNLTLHWIHYYEEWEKHWMNVFDSETNNFIIFYWRRIILTDISAEESFSAFGWQRLLCRDKLTESENSLAHKSHSF